jgi:hypothetical protein
MKAVDRNTGQHSQKLQNEKKNGQLYAEWCFSKTKQKIVDCHVCLL